ncbi:MAG: SRPBCC family protein [Thermocrispum sp.]
MAEPTAQSSIDIAAPPELVYRIVSDVENTPQWAAETATVKWLGGATGAEVGAKFRGTNKHNGRKWAMGCQVTDADEGRRFAFRVSMLGVPTAHWRYDIEPAGDGCRVTESTRRVAPNLPTRVVNKFVLGIRDRDQHNQRNIEQTLVRLKEFAEQQAAEQSA